MLSIRATTTGAPISTSAGGVTGTSLNGGAVPRVRRDTKKNNSKLRTGSRRGPGLFWNLASLANGTIAKIKVEVNVQTQSP
jgi:hypothetical protein